MFENCATTTLTLITTNLQLVTPTGPIGKHFWVMFPVDGTTKRRAVETGKPLR